MTAVLDIVRLHLLRGRPVPGALLVVAVFVGIGVGVTALEIAVTGGSGRWGTSGLVAVFYGGVAAVQAAAFTRLLPFAVGMGRTRRDFYLGTLLFALLVSVVLGGLLHLALVVERLTGGWGAGLVFLGASWAQVDDPVGQYLVLTAPFLLILPLVLLATLVLMRWGPAGLVLAAVVGVAVAYGVAVAVGLLTLGAGAAVLSTTLLVTIGLVAAAAGWGVVRRAPV